MKMKHLFTIIILVGAIMVSCSDDIIDVSSTSKFIVIPDANFEKELINQGIDSDGIVNQKVLRIDVIDVEYLNISYPGASQIIEDLTGIEGFTNLKRLYAIANRLTSVDISKNTKLDTLHLMANDLKSIKGLSKATNLKWLNLSHNLFEEFTLDNTSLTNILMSHNELVSFDASKAINLETVYLLTNKILSIDFANNPKLEAINVSNNKLTNINFGLKNKLYYLSIFENFITQLDVSNFDNLDYLLADRNPNLPCIKIKNGQHIPTLQLSDYQQVNLSCD
ncbi:hypothetical protein BA195_01905 [Tenacibaculum soleae]|uniref:Leucine-rich repeat domain-containing protein n=2 Tax=Tenacibaculum soleae TaxID=447689 RepID=A0A1B9Y111_9FLAO|nr:hypothetical protein BA195_01905 [Tenacibaculum soleae]